MNTSLQQAEIPESVRELLVEKLRAAAPGEAAQHIWASKLPEGYSLHEWLISEVHLAHDEIRAEIARVQPGQFHAFESREFYLVSVREIGLMLSTSVKPDSTHIQPSFSHIPYPDPHGQCKVLISREKPVLDLYLENLRIY